MQDLEINTRNDPEDKQAIFASSLVSTYVVCERLSVIQQQVCLVDFLSVTLSLSVT